MHELSICAAIARIVADNAAGRTVTRVTLDVGALRQVVPDTLAHAWGVAVMGTSLEGSILDVNHIPAVIECSRCGASTAIEVPVFRCPCGSTDTTVSSGRELMVRSLELEAA